MRSTSTTQNHHSPSRPTKALVSALLDDQQLARDDPDGLAVTVERRLTWVTASDAPASDRGFFDAITNAGYLHHLAAMASLARLLASIAPATEANGTPAEPEADSGDTTPRAGAPPGHGRATKRHQLALSCRSSGTSRGSGHHGPCRSAHCRYTGGPGRPARAELGGAVAAVAIRHPMPLVPHICVRRLSCRCSCKAAATTPGRQLSTV